ncbi:MAG: hypothetical protein GY786_07060 [Proteobacteria bacterium]|nr:hypothetical protein [Pseudomonadota bacterium]
MMSTISLSGLKPYQIHETLLVILATMGLPVLVHLLPTFNSTPLGAILLPMFIAPLIASLLYKPHVSLLAAFSVPLLSFSLTSRPESGIFLLMFLELLIFTILSLQLNRRRINPLGHVFIAFLAAKLFSLIWILYLPFNPYQGDGQTYFSSSMINGIPGVLIMAGITYFLFKKRDVR